MILRVLLEDIPRSGTELADELERVGTEIKQAAEKELAEFYPPDPDGARPIAYLWARTVRCEAPNCGAEIPLMRSFWLCKKANRRRALKYRTIQDRGQPPHVEFEIFEPSGEKEVSAGTVSRAKATCLCCNTVLSPDRVRAQLYGQRGGADVILNEQGQRCGGALLLAMVVLKSGMPGRYYRLPTKSDYQTVWDVRKRLKELNAKKLPNDLSPIPDEPTPTGGGSGAGRAFSLRKYGMLAWGDLFTARQKLALATLTEKVRGLPEGPEKTLMALLLSKFIELSTANCPWEPVAECPRKIFNMQAIPTRWEFAEGVVTSNSSGSIDVVISNVLATLRVIGSNWTIGQSHPADARESPLPDKSGGVWFTDPPYYDAVPYSD
jgi:adenine-specific DNA methylase